MLILLIVALILIITFLPLAFWPEKKGRKTYWCYGRIAEETID